MSSVPPPEDQELQETTERLMKMLRGQVSPPNSFVAYMLDKVKESRAEYEAVSANVRNLEQQLEALRRRQLMLQGEHDKYIEDIRNWDKEVVEEKPQEEEAQDD
jgi:hypothetical protein